ncbi:hypothetical protein ACWEOS_13265 [Micromonospora taraxaci]|uniref:hypothetical protein n=1 Tax=Micromonospora taraxaci TaxID=1316803 RepID=UPI003C2BB653
MKIPEDACECGICGGSLDERHAPDGPDGLGGGRGKRVEYVVVAKRGGIVDYQPVGDAAKSHRTDAAMLAFQLGVEESSLVGRRFSCWITPAEYGTFESDFRLIT